MAGAEKTPREQEEKIKKGIYTEGKKRVEGERGEREIEMDKSFQGHTERVETGRQKRVTYRKRKRKTGTHRRSQKDGRGKTVSERWRGDYEGEIEHA